MPDQREESTQSTARLPWESMDDGADVAVETEPPEPAESPAHVEPMAVYDSDAVDYERPVPAEPLEEDLGPPPRGGGWTLAVLCAGIGIIACCVLIPQADQNRRLVYEREKLKVDLDSIRKQVATNDEFLRLVGEDPNLSERLAQRQMKIIREGTRVLELKNARLAGASSGSVDDVSPFHLVAVAPPPPLAPYEPRGGLLAGLCYDPHTRLYLMGTGMLLMAVGLVLGFAPKG
jgi:hypothetical protein